MADRYISEEEFIAWVKEHWCADCQNANGLRCRSCWIDDAIDVVEEAPTADVVEVVRCKDCEYLTKEMIGDSLEFICKSTEGMVNPAPDFYCSYGRRKEDE